MWYCAQSVHVPPSPYTAAKYLLCAIWNLTFIMTTLSCHAFVEASRPLPPPPTQDISDAYFPGVRFLWSHKWNISFQFGVLNMKICSERELNYRWKRLSAELEPCGQSRQRKVPAHFGKIILCSKIDILASSFSSNEQPALTETACSFSRFPMKCFKCLFRYYRSIQMQAEESWDQHKTI